MGHDNTKLGLKRKAKNALRKKGKKKKKNQAATWHLRRIEIDQRFTSSRYAISCRKGPRARASSNRQ